MKSFGNCEKTIPDWHQSVTGHFYDVPRALAAGNAPQVRNSSLTLPLSSLARPAARVEATIDKQIRGKIRVPKSKITEN